MLTEDSGALAVAIFTLTQDMKDAVDWALLGRYVTGACSREEETRVKEWMARDEERAERVRRLRRIWNVAGVSAAEWNAREAWAKVQEREDAASSAPDEGSLRRDRSARRRSRHTRWSPLTRVAGIVAVLVVAVAGIVFLAERPVDETSPSETQVFTTREGERAVLRLSDGTQVHLNAQSRLTLLAGFAEGDRGVRLEGEAYFEVARDTTRPFRVYAGGATARVLGTAFDVAAYAGDDEVRVGVTEGEVALAGHSTRPDGVATLRPRSLGVVTSGRLVAVQHDVDLSSMLAWTEGRLVFKNAPFEEVVRRLERWYGLHIEVRVPPDTILGLNATFEDEPLSEVLRAVAVALDLKYTRADETITFYR